MTRQKQTTDLGDSFESLLRAAAEVSEVPIAASLLLQAPEAATLADGRFVIRRLLGKGGMGAVYEAEDRNLERAVALKILSRADARSIARFKREFRMLADTVHPHLVRLHDLFVEQGIWFFTMDLVEGSTLTVHLARAGSVGSEARETEVRRILPQLVSGVSAIHAQGLLHRDLKPENVLVSDEGCLVIVDFGLLADAPAIHGGEIGRAEVAGTVPYMAPEQARGEPATPASDWYAVGTILYEALTGERPLSGDAASVREQKRRGEMPALFLIPGPWPADLAELCRALLSPAQTERPPAEAIARGLQKSAARPAPPDMQVAPKAPIEPVFVGRAPELGTLGHALERTRGGVLVLCRVTGPAGIGKTALVGEFLRRVGAETSAVALCGRCHEREAMPYKLLDGIAEALFQSLPRGAPDAADLITAFSSLFLGSAGSTDPRQLARDAAPEPEHLDRAVQAFRTGLRELLKQGRVILHIDDVQWGDTDGIRLLDEILEPPAPPVLLILTHRDDESTEALRALDKMRSLRNAEVHAVPVRALAAFDMREIVREMAGRSAIIDAEAVARESEGNPFFAAEIVRHTLERAAGSATVVSASSHVPLTLGETILSRYRNLPIDTRRVLDTVILHDAPIAFPVLAAANRETDVDRAVAILRSASFVRTHRSRELTTIEPYHDRVREVIDRALPEGERRELHAGLAGTLEAASSDNWEQLLVHYEGAGEREKATQYALKSAERAFGAHAFVHAAALFRRTLELGTWPAGERRDLTVRLGDALAMGGHASEAADAYEAAAAGAPSAERVRLEMLAAGQLLCSGRIREGAARLSASVGYLGVSIPGPDESLAASTACVLEALSKGFGLHYRDETAVDAQELLRIDACWWAAKGLVNTTQPAGAFLLSYHLAEAVRAGEPMRIARGAYVQAANLSALQRDDLVPVVAALMQIADAAAEHAPSPNVRFWREYSLAFQSREACDVDRSIAHIEAAHEQANAGGHGLERELTLLNILEVGILYETMGPRTELPRHERWKRDALRRGDRCLMAWVRCFDYRWWLDDAPEPQRQDLLDLLWELSRTSDDDESIVWFVKITLCIVERYMGMFAEAFTRSEEVLRSTRSSPFWQIPRLRAGVAAQYVACAIAFGRDTGNLDLMREAEAIIAEVPPSASGMAAMLRAGIANVRGDRDEALRLLEVAISDPGRVAELSVALTARLFRGLLLGGPTGEALVQEAERAFTARGHPLSDRLGDAVWPGFGDQLASRTHADIDL